MEKRVEFHFSIQDPTANVFNAMEPDLVSVSKIIKEIRMKDVDPNVFWALNVQRTKLVSEINVRIHVQEFAV